MPRAKTPFQLCLAALRAGGMLPLEPRHGDSLSVATIIGRATQHGTTWSDPDAGNGAAVTSRLLQHDDVLALRLLAGKTTLVHRSLWPDLLAMATSGAPWQTDWLPRREAELLDLVETQGRVVVDRALAERMDAAPRHFGKTLESRLLVLVDCARAPAPGREFTSWWTWAEEKRVAPALNEMDARVRLEVAAQTVARWPHLPWFRKSVRRRY